MNKKCPINKSTNVKEIYTGPIRSGGADSGFEEGYRVLECRESGFVWLDPFPSGLKEYYETDAYWAEHHQGKTEVDHIRSKLDHEQVIWLSRIGEKIFRNKQVVDFGCGAGIFFDYIKGVADKCIGVDLAEPFARHLRSEGHEFYKYDSEIPKRIADVVVSFDTLEHVPDPIEFLKKIFKTLKPGGTLIIGVPNQNDYLKKIVPEYLKFFYHKSHLWYFTMDSLSLLLEKCGFKVIKKQSVHKYDINNMIVWARESKGCGKQGSEYFDEFTESNFSKNLERMGVGSHIMITAKVM
jgi:SAM-dependent methyltransferase